MEDHLYQQLKKFNETVENPYRENWGSTLSYLPAYENVKGRKADEVEIFKSITEKANALEQKRKKAAENSKNQKFVDKYGTTRFGIPNGRSVPKNAKDELKYNSIEKKIMQAQHKVVVKQRNQSLRSSQFQTKFQTTVSNFNRGHESTRGGDTIGQDIVLPQRLQGRNMTRIIETLDPKIESGHEQIRIETQGPLTCKNLKDNTQSSGRNDTSQLMTFGADQANIYTKMQQTEKNSGVFDVTRMTRGTGTTLTGTNAIEGQSNSNVFGSTKVRPQTSNATNILSNMRGEFSPADNSGFGDAFISNDQSNINNADLKSQGPFMNKPPNLPIGSQQIHKRAISNLIGTREQQINKSRFKLKDSTVGAWQGTSRSREKERNPQFDSKEGNVLMNSQVTDEYTHSRLSRSPLRDAETDQRVTIEQKLLAPKPTVKTAMGLLSSQDISLGQQIIGQTIESTSGTFAPVLSGKAKDGVMSTQMHYEQLQNQYKLSRPLRRINTHAKPTGQLDESTIERSTRPSVDGTRAVSLHQLRTIQATRSALSHAKSQLRNKCGVAQMSDRQGQMVGGSSRVTARLNSARLDGQNSQRIQFLEKETQIDSNNKEPYITQNVKKHVTQVYQAKRDPLNAKNDHVFKLQQSMRLATKFSGATNTLGKQKKMPSMEVRQGAAKSFKEQRMILQEAKSNPHSRVGPYIKANASVKQSSFQAIKEAQAKDLKRPQEPSTAGDAGKASEIQIKPKDDPSILGKASGFIENPRAINPKNKLQLAMIKHVQAQQLAVTDMFSKKADPLDRHYELEAQTQAVQAKRKTEDIQNLLKKHILNGYNKKQDLKNIGSNNGNTSILKKQRSVSDPVFFSKHDPQPCPKSSLNNQTYDEREDKLAALSHIALKEEKNSPAQDRIGKMPLELRTLIDVDPEEGNRLYKLMGLTNGQFLRNNDVEQFMNKHNFSTERQKTLKSNIQFSKEFFNIIDDDGTGGIELEELAQPLIALGLATDTGFVKRALKVLNPKKFGQGQFDKALTMKEFSRIFRTDPVSEKLNALIKEELDRQEDLKLVQMRQNQAFIEERIAEWEKYGMQVNSQLFDEIPEDSDEGSLNDGAKDHIISIDDNGSAEQICETDRELQNSREHTNQEGYKGQKTIVNQPQNKIQPVPIRLSKTDISPSKNLKVQVQGTSSFATTKQFGADNSIGANKGNSSLGHSKKKVYDINDQVKVVAKWWKQLQIEDLEAQKAAGEQNCVERNQLPAQAIAKQFLAWRIFQDMTAAKKYIVAAIGEDKTHYEFNSFGAVFIKGIFKDVVCGIASSVQNYRRKDEENVSQEVLQQKALLWKLSDYKRENLFEMMARGLVRTKQEPQRIVERPIFQNLYNLKYRSDPERWKNANFERYLKKTINKMPATEDPFQIPTDDYNSKINFIVADYSKEINAFNQMLNNDDEIHIENEVDFVKHADDHEKKQIKGLKKIQIDESPEPVQIEYPNDAKRKRFHLNQEKENGRADVDRINGQKCLIDGLDRIQRDEVEKGLLYDQIIINHKIAERQMFLYSNPQTGGLQPDEIVEADQHLPKTTDTVASVSPLKENVFDGEYGLINDTASPKVLQKEQIQPVVKEKSEQKKKMDRAIANIRADKKEKHELLDRLTAASQFEIQKFQQ